MPVPTHVASFWDAYSRSIGGADEKRFYEAFHFGDSEELANHLVELVLSGAKRATTSSLWSFETEGKRLPIPGDLSVVTDWAGAPRCLIETTAVEIVPFSEVSADFAAAEGEGEGSLQGWQEAHRRFFTRESARHGRRFTEDMRVACERFMVVFPPGRL